jgi:hypothetical protein
MMIHVPHQILCIFVLNIQHIYAPQRLKPPFARNDQVRLYVLESLEMHVIRNEYHLNCAEYGLQT